MRDTYYYREYELTTLSSDSCTKFLRAVALSGGQICSSFVLNNSFPEHKVGRWSMFFKLEFKDRLGILKLKELGIETTEPKRAGGNINM